MSQPNPTNAQTEIREVLARINHAWSKLRGEAMTAALNECFADEIVFRGPAFVFLGKGRAAAVQSYHDFVNQADVKNFQLDEPQIDVAGDTATAQYKWTMTYVLSGQQHTEHGHDLFVFTRRDGKWLAVWRALLPEQAEIASEAN